VKKEEKELRPRYGIVNFEKRKHPRFNVDLPIEHARSDLVTNRGEALNASEGGLLIYLPEKMEVGQHLSLKLFFSSGPQLNTVEALVQVVWMDIHLGEDWGDYRAGVKFVDISAADLEKLRNFLRSLSGQITQGMR
jgi:c-di-GMP-binding flagellar brake protein YcgR